MPATPARPRPARTTPLLRHFASVLVLGAACVAVPVVVAQEAGYVALEDRFTATQLRDAGLHQLDAAQLARLDALLRDDHEAQLAALREQARREAAAAAPTADDAAGGGPFDRRAEPVVGRIVGPFRGWENGTTFTLANGQRWRVVQSPAYYLPRSRAVEGPAVVVAPGLVGGWYLQVEGQSPRAKVQLVR